MAWLLNKIPSVGEQSAKLLSQGKDALKHFLHGGMLFEELGFRYVGPVDGHDLKTLTAALRRVKHVKGPVLLHVLTEKGHGFAPAASDPVTFHTPAPFRRDETGQEVAEIRTSSTKAYTDHATAAIHAAMTRDDRVAVMTAAMCQGNKLEQVREDFPDRFFDTGICEGHAVAFAGGMAKAGAKPIVDIYSAPSCNAASTTSSRRSPCKTCRSSSRWTGPGCAGRTGPRTTACSTTAICGSSRT